MNAGMLPANGSATAAVPTPPRPLHMPAAYARLPLAIVLFIGVALLIGYAALTYLETFMVASTGQTLAVTAKNIVEATDWVLADRYGDIQAMAQNPVVIDGDPRALEIVDAHERYIGAGHRLGRGLGHRVSARRRRPGFASWAGPRVGPGSSRSSDRRAPSPRPVA